MAGETERSEQSRAPLEDVMLAMDVVDTLRHRRGLVDRELNAEERRARLVERLREIYAAQGMDVSDAVLEQGVLALEDDRFTYTPATSGFQVKLARIYASRRRWGKPLIAVLALAFVVWLVHYLVFEWPDNRRAAALPTELNETFARIVNVSETSEATDRAQVLLRSARGSLADDDLDAASESSRAMKRLLAQLEASYTIRVVSRPDEFSGVWRIPDANPDARNYYIIVEGIDPAGRVVPVAVTNEEDGSVQTVEIWGLRVSESVFQSVGADKQDDGIIQDNHVGNKVRGQLEPEYAIATTGDTITSW